MIYLPGDRITLNGRTGSVAVDLGDDRFGVLLDRQRRGERYEDLHVFAQEEDLTPLTASVEDEEYVPTFDEGLEAAAKFAVNARPDLENGIENGWKADFNRWVRSLTEHHHSIGSGGFTVTRIDEDFGDDDPLVSYEIVQHVVTLYPATKEDPKGSAFIWNAVKDFE